MSDPHALFETAIIISPEERISQGTRERLPIHINVVDQFAATRAQTDRLMRGIAAPLFRNTFEITGFEHGDRGIERLQRLGGSVLHGLHDDIVAVMDRLHITHTNTTWDEGSSDTWYGGTWHVPGRRTKIDSVHVAQEMPDHQGWRVLRTYNLHVPSDDFRRDPLYLDSLYNPVSKRRAG